MGWFNKKEKVVEKEETPLLPKLPEFPEIEENIRSPPDFPSNSLKREFPQNNLDEAIIGEEEDDGVFKANDFKSMDDRMRTMQKPLKKPLTEEFPFQRSGINRVQEISKGFGKVTRKSEPVFIRIDKFEESIKVFEKAKKQIPEIERMIQEIKRIKEEEEKELEFWENEIQTIKSQIERVDKDIFSKIE